MAGEMGKKGGYERSRGRKWQGLKSEFECEGNGVRCWLPLDHEAKERQSARSASGRK